MPRPNATHKVRPTILGVDRRRVIVTYRDGDLNIYPIYHLGLYVDGEGKHVRDIKHKGDQTVFELIFTPDV